ncbi:MAG: hypothetical protein HZC40_06730 [Chloroflexi bacterium]|nr:hypothetical protein [Chloroflexota bacterium]
MKLNSRRVGAIFAIIFFLLCLASVKTKPESWNDIARVASIESLVERGTWAIDESAWVDRTADKVFLGGKFYSDKLPLLSIIGAGVYAMLRNTFGASLAPDCARCAYAPLVLILVSLPVALTLWLFFDFAARQNVPVWAATLGTSALGTGPMLLPYALVLNHHVPAASALFASFYFLWRGLSSPHGQTRKFAPLAAGFFAALAISFDIPSGIIAASLFGIALARYRIDAIYFALGGALPFALTALLDYQIAGTIIPAYLIPEGYAYPGSEFPAIIGGNAGTPDDYAAYAFRMFLGGKGLFAYNPLLLFAFVGAMRVAFTCENLLRIEGAWIALGFSALCLYLALGTGNFGGNAYGERWFIPAIPVLFAFIFFAPPLNLEIGNWKLEVGSDSTRQALQYLTTMPAWFLFASALVLSIFSSLQGAQAPWQDILPPLQMTRSSQLPIFGLRWNVRLP